MPHPRPAQPTGAVRSMAPILPPSMARPAPRFESRAVEVDLALTARPRRTSVRAYLVGVGLLAAISVAGWFALGAYIYG